MKSLLSFLGFVVFAAAVVTGIYFWRQAHPLTIPESSLPSLTALDREFTSLVAHVLPSVVSINALPASATNPRELMLRRMMGPEAAASGSGVIVSTTGHIVTNLHVITGAGALEVQLGDGRIMPAAVVGADPLSDIAILKIEAEDLTPLPFADSDAVKVGQMVFAVGNPLGLHETVTQGIVSAKGRRAQSEAANEFFQTDAAINPGNSGGPLVNLRGEVIGLNSAIQSQTGFYSGYGFAIPITLVKNVADALIKDGRVRMPVMGVSVTRVDPEDAGINGLAKVAGVKVAGFNPPDGGPAKAAGIEVGDVITTVDGKPVDRVSALQRIVRMRRIGDVIPVEVVRFGTKKSFRVKLVDAEAGGQLAVNTTEPTGTSSPAAGKLGLSVEALPEEMATRMKTNGRGVRVSEVSQDGPARDKIAAGSDVLLEVLYPTPRRAIRSVTDLQNAISGLKDGDYVSLLVQSLDPRVGQRVVNIRVGG